MKRGRRELETEEASDGYFESYGQAEIHEQMLRCRRTDAYVTALAAVAPSLIRGKAVLDVGCGTGVLSLACARLGARVVYAVEASGMAVLAERIVRDNKMAGVVKVSLPEKVDLLVSEWMGSFLLYERMLPSVLYARDKWLFPTGAMLPSRARLWLAPYRDETLWEEAACFWTEPVHGFDMSAMLPLALAESTSKPHITLASPDGIFASPYLLADLDLAAIPHPGPAARGAPLDTPFHFRSHVASTSGFVGFVGWFDVQFRPGGEWLDTSPQQPPTHWQQVIYFWDSPWDVSLAQDDELRGNIKVEHSESNDRCLTVRIECHHSRRRIADSSHPQPPTATPSLPTHPLPKARCRELSGAATDSAHTSKGAPGGAPAGEGIGLGGGTGRGEEGRIGEEGNTGGKTGGGLGGSTSLAAASGSGSGGGTTSGGGSTGVAAASGSGAASSGSRVASAPREGETSPAADGAWGLLASRAKTFELDTTC